jgi:NAD(P)H dehydrogenase (quinone)
MRVLTVYAHPSDDCFDALVHQRAVDVLGARGHELRSLDLYRDGFDPRLSEFEWRHNQDVPANRAPVQGPVDDLQWADALVLVFPTWWSGPPAMLKGWLDRVFLPGVVFSIKAGRLAPRLTGLRYWIVLTTGGASKPAVLALGDPVRLQCRAWRLGVAPRAKSIFLRLDRMDATTPAERTRFLERVAERLKSV